MRGGEGEEREPVPVSLWPGLNNGSGEQSVTGREWWWGERASDACGEVEMDDGGCASNKQEGRGRE